MSALTMADLAAALEVLLKLIPQELAAGNIVDLGEFGSFRLSVNASGTDTAVAATANHIRRLSVRFSPGKEFKHALERVQYEKIG